MMDVEYGKLSRCDSLGLELFIQSDLKALNECRKIARDFLNATQAPPKQVEDLELIIDESLTNVVRHSYGDASERPVQMKLSWERLHAAWGAQLSILLVDQGHGGRSFRPEDRWRENQARKERGEAGGFGLILLYELMDQVDYRVTTLGNNFLLLRKRFTSQMLAGKSFGERDSDTLLQGSAAVRRDPEVAALWRTCAMMDAELSLSKAIPQARGLGVLHAAGLG